MRYTAFCAPAKSRSKYGNKKTVVDGFTFDSKKEADYYRKLTLLRRAGEVLTFLMQVPFHLPGGVKYIADFLVFYVDGRVDVVDVKGVKTPVYRLKKKQVEELYPVSISEI